MRDGQREWTRELWEFTNRNAGRRTILEVNDPGFGAQEEETDYPLKGVSFDPRDHRVQIMLGEEGSVDQHLTHSIEAAERIDILSSPDGRDEVLRIVHGGSQTLLRFVRA